VPFHRGSEDWTIEDEQCQRIGGRIGGSDVQIFTVSLNGVKLIYADPESNIMKPVERGSVNIKAETA
jgi:hypothetical protein